MKFIFLLFLGLVSSFSFAQGVEITLLDSKSKKPIQLSMERSMDDFDDFQIEEISGFDFAEASFDGLFDEDDEDKTFNSFLKGNYDYWVISTLFLIMTPDTLNFTGDSTTILGFVGVISTLVIVFTSFKRFYNSPYNFRVKTQTSNETPELYTETNDWYCKCSPSSPRTSTNLEEAGF